MKQIPLFIFFSLILLIAFGFLDFFISEKIFCPSCDYDDGSFLYKLFYKNSSNSGYHSEPTILNIIVLFLLSFSISVLILKNRKRKRSK